MNKEQDLFTIATQFEVQGFFLDAAPYGKGHIHQTFLAHFSISTRVIRILFQRINESIFKSPLELMDNIVRVTQHMWVKLSNIPGAEPDIETVSLIPAKNGGFVWRDAKGGYWRAYNFINGTRMYDVCEKPQQAYEAARVVGRFQNCLTDLPGARLHETIPQFHNVPRRLKALEEAVEKDAANRCAKAQAEIDFVMARTDLAPTIVKLMESGKVPERITHNDTKLNNVLFDNSTDRALCLVDLDTVMPGCVLYDFGDMVRTMTSGAEEDERDLSKVNVDLKRFDALVRGYLESARGMLTPDEIANLVLSGRVMTYMIGIRFLTDYLSGDTYFRTDRPEQNLDRCRAQFKLLLSQEAQEDEMEAAVRKHAKA